MSCRNAGTRLACRRRDARTRLLVRRRRQLVCVAVFLATFCGVAGCVRRPALCCCRRGLSLAGLPCSMRLEDFAWQQCPSRSTSAPQHRIVRKARLRYVNISTAPEATPFPPCPDEKIPLALPSHCALSVCVFPRPPAAAPAASRCWASSDARCCCDHRRVVHLNINLLADALLASCIQTPSRAHLHPPPDPSLRIHAPFTRSRRGPLPIRGSRAPPWTSSLPRTACTMPPASSTPAPSPTPR